MPILKYNNHLITKREHAFLHRHKELAGFIVIYGLAIRHRSLKKTLIEISNNKTECVVIGCSRGRLRSPLVWLYARYLGIDAKILYKGIKQFYDYKI